MSLGVGRLLGVMLLPGIVLVILATLVALPAAAQQEVVSLAAIERQYPKMSPIHIEKCDHDHDGMFTRTEQLCVGSIYRVMYLDQR
jgi:hypothetical protein